VGLLANDIGILGLSCEEIDRVNWFSLAVRARWNARDLVGVRRSANNLGVSYLNLGDFDNADRAYNEALIAATELKDELAIMRIRSNMAFVQALLAAGSSRDAGPSGLIIDKGSVAWRRAKTNFDLSLATALDAGLGEAEVCAGWEEYSVTCALLAR
jgi:tetratricopeptide (TPR) repeat protein